MSESLNKVAKLVAPGWLWQANGAFYLIISAVLWCVEYH
jgi:hypothetical protein